VKLGARAGSGGSLSRQYCARALETESGGHEWMRVKVSAGEHLDGGIQRGRPGKDADGGDVLEDQRSSVENTRHAGESYVHDAAPWLDEVQRSSGQMRRVRCVDNRVEREIRQCLFGPDVAEAQRAGEVKIEFCSSHEMHISSRLSHEHRRQESDGARSEHQRSIAVAHVGGLRRTERVGAGLYECSERVINRVRQFMKRGHRHHELLGQGARTLASHAHFFAVGTHVLMTAPATSTDAIAEHRVSHDAPSDPSWVDARADGRDHARPFVTQSHWVMRVPFFEVGHLAGEELDVGATETHSCHVDDGFARSGSGCGHVFDGVLVRSTEDKCPDRMRHRPAPINLARPGELVGFTADRRTASSDEEVQVRSRVGLKNMVNIQSLPAAMGIGECRPGAVVESAA